MKGYYKLLVALLQQHGFHLARSGKGSHEIWSNGKVSTTVHQLPAPPHRQRLPEASGNPPPLLTP